MRSVLTVCLIVLGSTAPTVSAQGPDTAGGGWHLARLDIAVRADSGGQRLAFTADLAVRLTLPMSRRITLVMPNRNGIVGFDSVQVNGGQTLELDGAVPGRGSARRAIIELTTVAREGDERRIRVFWSSRNSANQFTLAEDIALASWVVGWYPIPLPGGGGLGEAAKAVGDTRFDLPADWQAVSNGVLIDSRIQDGRRLERWTTVIPLARSFAAARYRVISATEGDRQVQLYLLSVGEAEARVQAAALARSIAALERRFGPYPTGGYAIAEVPDWVPGFLASSEQGFMMTKPQTFAVVGGNIPLFAHEAAHGYWGNTLVSNGPGSGFLSESIAQYGAYLAIEEILGADSALSFLQFSREGYIPLQSARGYFEVIRRGADSIPISHLTDLSGHATRIVADAKGPWVYQMLRRRLGDDRFFRLLRGFLESHTGAPSTLVAFREFATRVSGDPGLPAFFAQWLDRTGAPRLETTWQAQAGVVTVEVVQTQPGEPFDLDVALLIEGAGGQQANHRVRLSGPRTMVTFPFPGAIARVVVDPGFEILRWDEEYRMPTGA